MALIERGAFERSSERPDREASDSESRVVTIASSLRPLLIDGAAADVGGRLLAGGRLDGVPGEADVAYGQVGAVVCDYAGGMAAPAGSADQVVV